MLDRVLSTPRPEPSKVLPAVGASLVLALALPIFIVAGWSLAGWVIGTVLWVGTRLLGIVLARMRSSVNTAAGSGLLAFGLMFKSLAVLVVLIAVAASHPRVALAGTIVFALAYTVELALSLFAYFGAETEAR
jgi:hypothetical protein